VADFDRIASGRNRLVNLVDWVKANLTRRHKTRTVTFRGKECRVCFDRVLRELVELPNR